MSQKACQSSVQAFLALEQMRVEQFIGRVDHAAAAPAASWFLPLAASGAALSLEVRGRELRVDRQTPPIAVAA